MKRPTVDRATILRLAAESELDPRTVRSAIEHGLDRMKSAFDRERLTAAAEKMGVKLP